MPRRDARSIPMKPAHFTAIVVAVMAAVGFALYANGLHSPFIWDDGYLITTNHLIQDPRHLPELFVRHLYYASAQLTNYYRPLQSLVLMIEFQRFHLDPFGYHVTSVTVHILCAVAAFLLIETLFRARWVAVAAAFLFLVHPINSTVVDYISSRADSLAALFELLALWLFFKSIGYPRPMPAATPGKPKRAPRPSFQPILYALSLCSFALALLSKETAVSLPVLLVVTVALLEPRALRKTLPHVAMLAVYVALRVTALSFPYTPIEGAPPLGARLITSAVAFVKLMGSLFHPVRIHIEKFLPYVRSPFEPRAVVSILVLAAIAGFAVWVRRRSPPCFLGLCWFFIGLLPVSGIVPLNTTIADHWLYLPSIGFFLAITAGAADGLRALAPSVRTRARTAAMASLGAVLIVLSVMTVRQNRIWHDPVAFFKLGLQSNPASFRAHNELGVIDLNRGRWDEAIAEFKAALRANPRFDQALDNLGVAYVYKGDPASAEQTYVESLKHNPNNPKTYNNLGNVYLKQGQTDEAIALYTKALELNAGYRDAYNNLATAYWSKGDLAKAQALLERALQIDPRYAMAANSLAKIKEQRAQEGK